MNRIASAAGRTTRTRPVAVELRAVARLAAVWSATERTVGQSRCAIDCGIIVSMTAELDYAFLAEYAKTELGTITAIGASFTEVKATAFPSVVDIAVAGRIRWPEDEDAPELSISIRGPGETVEPQIEFDFNLEREENAVRYDGKVASVFVFRGPVLITDRGLYECFIKSDGKPVRRLAFEVVTDVAE